MPIRISGMNSGLDTESLISELVSAYRTKTQKYTKAQTKLSWKQEVWKGLNSKVSSFYSKLTSLRYSSAYNLKTATISDSTKASVKASASAINGTYSMKITQVAKSGYLTGAKLDSSITESSTLADLGYTGDDGTITVKVNGKRTDIAVNGSMKVSEFVSKLNGAGVKANFDAANHRIFVASSSTGSANNFLLTGTDADGAAALKAFGLKVEAAEDKSSYSQWAKYSGYDEAGIQTLLDDLAAASATVTKNNAQMNYAKAYQTTEDVKKNLTQDEVEELQSLLKKNDSNVYHDKSGNVYEKTADGKYADKATGQEYTSKELEDAGIKIQSRLEYLEEKAGFTKEVEVETKDASGNKITTKETVIDNDAVKDYKAALSTVASYEEVDENGNKINEAEINEVQNAYAAGGDALDNVIGTLQGEVKDAQELLKEHDLLNTGATAADIMKRIQYAVDTLANGGSAGDYSTNPSDPNAAKHISGQNAIIEINGATFESASNEMTVNGLTINAMAATGKDEVTVTIGNNTQGLYDKIKGILKDYNELINEMTKLYNAGSSRGYEPLTSEEKDALSDTEVEEWEKKIKDSLLRRDDTLGSLLSGMSSAMLRSYTINGKNYSLSSFGIHTLGILNSADNEQNAFHIDGDEDDSLTSSNADKLMAALTNDPDSVVEFMKQLTGGVYDSINKKMGSTTLSSFNVVYNDKEMAREYSDYTKTISKWEEKLQKMEDSYYRKFAAMESALATLQSQQSYLASLFG